jgi:iron complex transport system ATP-binding protein
MNCALKTYDLSIGYHLKRGENNILHHDIDLELNAGEITCLLGPNGSGKSTLIRTFSGFQPALAGEVLINQKSLNQFSARDLAKVLSVVLTEHPTVGQMTVFSMVAYGRSPYTGFLGKLTKEDKLIIEEALQNAGITELRNRQFQSLSDGEKQKVFISKSLAQETQLMFLDEPTAFLDFPSKIEILQLLRKTAWEQDKAILLSTHDLNLALQFADKIWLMAHDKPIVTGVPEDLVLSGKFGDYFDHDKISFDKTSGSFTFDAATKQSIIVTGQHIKLDWLRKALRRKGFEVLDNIEKNVSICEIGFNTEANYFELKTKGNVQNFQDIEDLIVFLIGMDSIT